MLPPAYVLSSISTHLPDFISRDKDKQKVAKSQWWKECEDMQNALEITAKKVFDEETARKYIMSGNEQGNLKNSYKGAGMELVYCIKIFF